MTQQQSDEEVFRNFAFDCELTMAVNPVTYTECRLDPPVKILSYNDFTRFNDKWEKFCRHAADQGIVMETARFEL